MVGAAASAVGSSVVEVAMLVDVAVVLLELVDVDVLVVELVALVEVAGVSPEMEQPATRRVAAVRTGNSFFMGGSLGVESG